MPPAQRAQARARAGDAARTVLDSIVEDFRQTTGRPPHPVQLTLVLRDAFRPPLRELRDLVENWEGVTENGTVSTSDVVDFLEPYVRAAVPPT